MNPQYFCDAFIVTGLLYRKRCFLTVWTMGGVLWWIGPYVSTINSSGHDRPYEVCDSALRSVHFIDVNIVDRSFGDGRIEPGEQLFEGFVLAPAEHGDCLASF